MSGPLEFRSQRSTSLPLKLEAGITRRCRERAIVRVLSSQPALQQNNGDASGTYVTGRSIAVRAVNLLSDRPIVSARNRSCEPLGLPQLQRKESSYVCKIVCR